MANCNAVDQFDTTNFDDFDKLLLEQTKQVSPSKLRQTLACRKENSQTKSHSDVGQGDGCSPVAVPCKRSLRLHNNAGSDEPKRKKTASQNADSDLQTESSDDGPCSSRDTRLKQKKIGQTISEHKASPKQCEKGKNIPGRLSLAKNISTFPQSLSNRKEDRSSANTAVINKAKRRVFSDSREQLANTSSDLVQFFMTDTQPTSGEEQQQHQGTAANELVFVIDMLSQLLFVFQAMITVMNQI